MLFLQFWVGNDRYAIPASQVAEIIPLISFKKIPKAPRYVPGLINYRGVPVPVIDLCALAFEKPCRKQLSTRIILVRYPLSPSVKKLLGIIAERVLEVIHSEDEGFVPPGLHLKEAPFLKGVKTDEDGMVQWIAIEHLLPDHIQEILFQEEETDSSGTAQH